MIKATAVAMGVSLCFVAAAGAHPVDELIQGAYLTLKPGAVGIELDLMPGSEVAGAILVSIDTNQDGALSDEEAASFADTVLAGSSVDLDGSSLAWQRADVYMPAYADLAGAGGVIRIYATAQRVDNEGEHTFTYRNVFAPVKSEPTANVFLQNGDWIYQVQSQHRAHAGQSLTVVFTANPK